MSRPLRIDYPGAWHHVMNRSRSGTDLYRNKEDYELFLSLVQETSASWGQIFNIDKYLTSCSKPFIYSLWHDH